MFAFGAPGPMELMIIGVILIIPAAVVIALVVVLTRSRKPSDSNPNLKPCPDCRRFVSLQATTCPHCGRPLQSKQ